MPPGTFNLHFVDCCWNPLIFLEPFQMWIQRAVQRETSIPEPVQFPDRGVALQHVMSCVSAYLLLCTVLEGFTAEGGKGDAEGLRTKPWVVQPVMTRTGIYGLSYDWALIEAGPTGLCCTPEEMAFAPAQGSDICERAESFVFLSCFFNRLYWGITHLQ